MHVAIAAAGKPPLERTVGFRHEWHGKLQCAACHGTPVTLAPVDSALTCQGCHADHHQAGRSCATCHRTDSIKQPHMLPVQAHLACDRCHSTAAIAPLTPTRSFCLACHDPSVDHHPERECVGLPPPGRARGLPPPAPETGRVAPGVQLPAGGSEAGAASFGIMPAPPIMPMMPGTLSESASPDGTTMSEPRLTMLS